jgi:hypothetical protein
MEDAACYKIKKYMYTRRMSIRVFSGKIGINYSTLSKLLSDPTRYPSRDVASKLVKNIKGLRMEDVMR